MSRAPRSTGRGLIGLLLLAVSIGLIFIAYRTEKQRELAVASAPTPTPQGNAPTDQLPALSVTVDKSAIDDRAVPAPTAPLPTPAVGQTPTSAPPSVVQTPAAQADRTHDWSQLLTGGSNNGAAPAAGPAPADQPIITGKGALADGQARLAAGQFVDAAAVLNDALQANKLSDADAEAARAQMAQINQTVIFSPKVFAGEAYVGSHVVRPGESLARIANACDTSWELLSMINKVDARRLRAGARIKIIRGPFFADVRKKAFEMDMYLGGLPGEKGSMYVTSFKVGLGREDSTPTGLWAIGPHAKLRHPTYYPPEGGAPIDADDPKNPLGGYWIALTGMEGQAVGKASYGIHGTIEPDSIGKQSSMGCIRLGSRDIPLVFAMMTEGKSMVRVEP